MNIQTSNSRITWIDMAKGYGTILVIYAHLGRGALWTWIYSFHLPLFFFLSGYVFSPKYKFKDFFYKKLKSIFLPYFCLGIPIVLAKELHALLIAGNFSIADTLYHMNRLLLQQRFWTLWFIACLFCLNFLFYFLVKLCLNSIILLFISLTLPCIGLYYYRLGDTPLYWNADVCVMAIPFFTLGYLYKVHAKQIDDFFMTKSILFFVLFAMINIISWRLSLDETGLGLEMFNSNYGKPLFTYVAAFTGIFCIVILSKWITIKPISYLGENSMIYYAWHQSIMIPIFKMVFSIVGIDVLTTYGTLGVVVYKCICLIGIIIALTFCNWCIKKLGLNFIIGK